MDSLRTATPMGDWRSFKFTHPNVGETWAEGSLYWLQDHTIGVLLLDIQYTAAGCKKAKAITYGEEGVLIYHAEKIMVDKVHTTGDAFLPGDKVYWNGVQGAPVTPNVTTGYWWIGIAVAPAGQFETEVMIDLKGDKASQTEPL